MKEIEASGILRPNRFLLWIALLLALASLSVSGYSAWKIRDLTGKLENLSFQQTAAEYGYDNDLLTPEVGVIQFMHKGYSIRFDKISYTSSGLEVEGTIGNPSLLTLSSLNLKLSARQFLYKNRDKILKDPFYLFTDSGDIGSGQTTVGYLGSGKTASFAMTIPNVKQTPDGIQIAVSFSGERYNY